MAFKSLLLACVVCITGICNAQTEAYFQQQLSYDIDAQLDDKKKELSAKMRLVYVNNSPDTLDYLIFHLWANAFKDRNTHYAKDQWRRGNDRFYFAKEDARGGYTEIQFRQNDAPLQSNIYQEQIDIVKIELESPIVPGDSALIAIDYTLDIPYVFSKLGHKDSTFYMCYWYPRPAVYNKSGWNAFPYSGIGAYFGEFADWNVNITLPSQYIVAASANLQSADERTFLDSLINHTRALVKRGFPIEYNGIARADSLKSLSYTAENIHDFCWIANKNFYLAEKKVAFQNKDSISAYTYFTNENVSVWQQAMNNLISSTRYMSAAITTYPYKQISIVEANIDGESGIEYPQLILLRPDLSLTELEEVVIHKTAHQWFYGVLGFNERKHAWINEGLSSYYEKRYLSDKYSGKESQRSRISQFNDDLDVMEIAYLRLARQDMDQVPALPSDSLSLINSYVAHSIKPAIGFRVIASQSGRQSFDSAMVKLATERSFKHSMPEDLRKYLESETGESLGWFFDHYIATDKKIDFKLSKISNAEDGNLLVGIENKGDVNPPFQLSGYRNDSIIYTDLYSISGQKGELKIRNLGYDKLEIDANHLLPELYRKNNARRIDKWPKRWNSPSLHFLIGKAKDDKNDMYWSPIVAWNNYDKSMIGAAFYNRTLLSHRFEWAVVPLVSNISSSPKLSGVGEARLNFYPQKPKLKRIQLGVRTRAFARDRLEDGKQLRYSKLTPNANIIWKKDKASTKFARLGFQVSSIQDMSINFSSAGEIESIDKDWRFIPQLKYELVNNHKLSPSHVAIAAEYQQAEYFSEEFNYLKLSVTAQKSWTYRPGKQISLRAFGGWFAINEQRQALGSIRQAFTLFSQGFNDYTYSRDYIGRSEQSDIWSRQISIAEGGFKDAVGSPFSNVIGQSNDYLLSLNISAHIPLKLPAFLPLAVYADIGYAHNQNSTQQDVLVSSGLMMRWLDGAFGVYLPLIQSSKLSDIYKQSERNDLFSRLSFSIDLARIHPWRSYERQLL